MKYVIGYYYNPGFNERGMESICHTVMYAIEKGEADKLPTIGKVWKRLKEQLKDYTVLRKSHKWANEVPKERPLRRQDIVIGDENSRIYQYATDISHLIVP